MFDRLNIMTFRFSITLIAIVSLLGFFVAAQDAPNHGPDNDPDQGPYDGKYAWYNGNATFYGLPNASGPPDNGGKCGFKNINLPPYNSFTASTSKAIWQDGKGCGSCYLVACNKEDQYPMYRNPLCSGKQKLITITDECLHDRCAEATYHFDMSGILFGSLADPGKEHEVHKAGKFPIVVSRVPCDYKGRNIHFHVSKGSNPYYLALLTEYQNGEGDLSKLEIKEAGSSKWNPLKHSWGKMWSLHSPHPLKGPFSIRVTTLSGKWSLVTKNAIPADWKPDTKYDSKVHFPIDISPWLT